LFNHFCFSLKYLFFMQKPQKPFSRRKLMFFTQSTPEIIKIFRQKESYDIWKIWRRAIFSCICLNFENSGENWLFFSGEEALKISQVFPRSFLVIVVQIYLKLYWEQILNFNEVSPQLSPLISKKYQSVRLWECSMFQNYKLKVKWTDGEL
jgi:hypothetical protein